MGNMIALVANEILKKRNLVVLTGAGISTDSGIPDFRSKNGVYARWDRSRVFDLQYFYSHPDYFWKYAKEELYTLQDKKPNRTHMMLAFLEKQGYLKAVITQNIDRLHQKAGSLEVIELHGSIAMGRCLKCGKKYTSQEITDKISRVPVPHCDLCLGLIKPDIVFFGESLDPSNIELAVDLSSRAELFLVMGSSLAVYPAASLPRVAKNSGALSAIVNREETGIDSVFDYTFKTELLEFSDQLYKYLRKHDPALK